MSEIEKCACGQAPALEAVQHAEGIESRIHCHWCGRASITAAAMPTNPMYPIEPTQEQWNHDQRGLRLLRELANCHARYGGFTCGPEDSYEFNSITVPTELWKQVQDWDEEGGRD